MKVTEFGELLAFAIELARDAYNILRADKPNYATATDEDIIQYHENLKVANAILYDLNSIRIRASKRQLEEINKEMQQALDELTEYNDRINGFVSDLATAKEVLTYIAQLVLVSYKI